MRRPTWQLLWAVLAAIALAWLAARIPRGRADFQPPRAPTEPGVLTAPP